MTAPNPSRLALERPCSMEAVNTLFSPARPIAATWAFGSFSSFLNKLLRFNSAFALQMRGVAYFYLVIVYPYIDQLRGLAAKDHLVITGILQFRRQESTHHGISHQQRLRRIGGNNGTVGAGSRRAAQKTGAENQWNIGRKGISFRGNPIPQYLGVRTQTPR